MKTAYNSLRDILPKVIDVICLVNGLNRVCIKIRVK